MFAGFVLVSIIPYLNNIVKEFLLLPWIIQGNVDSCHQPFARQRRQWYFNPEMFTDNPRSHVVMISLHGYANHWHSVIQSLICAI